MKGASCELLESKKFGLDILPKSLTINTIIRDMMITMIHYM